MEFEIRQAGRADVRWIQDMSRSINRPPRKSIETSEYLIAESGGERIGSAGVSLIPDGGYLYGLVVLKSHRRRGIGAALTNARVERVRDQGGGFALALAMFWNVRFFRSLGFDTTPRAELPAAVLALPDFSNPIYRRSAVVIKRLSGK